MVLLEGLTLSPKQRTLWLLLESAAALLMSENGFKADIRGERLSGCSWPSGDRLVFAAKSGKQPLVQLRG
jgi:hypothetical protein